VLLLPPWRRAPLLPFGQPAVILAVVAASAILACASASAALFLSSASSASLQRLISAECPGAAAVELQATDTSWTESTLTARVESALARVGLPRPALSLLAEKNTLVGTPSTPNPVRMIYRTDALANVTVLSGRRGTRGVWLSEAAASRSGVRTGDRVPIGSATVPVAGIFRNLFQEPPRPYWCPYRQLIFNLANEGRDPPPLAIASDPDTLADVVGLSDNSTFRWQSPPGDEPMTLSRGRELAARQAEAYRLAGLPPPDDFGAQNSGGGQLPELTERAALIRDGLRGPVLPIALGGTLLALLLVGAAGSYWADRRYTEVRLLSARGVGPGPLAGKAVLELAIPAAVGTVLGWLLSRWLVTALGPSPDLDAVAPRWAALTAAAALVVGLALLGLVAGLRARNATERPVGARSSRLAPVPWELVPLGAAGACYLALRSGQPVVLVENVAQVNLLVVAFPLLFIVGAALLAVRLLALLLPALARQAAGLPPAAYLALRRLTASRLVSVVLLAAASAPVAMTVYAAGLTTGSERTLAAKAHTFVGSDAAVLTNDPLERTAQTDRVGTVVVRYLYGQVAGADVAVLAVDPDTLPAAAFWRGSYADRPLPELLDRLRAQAAGGAVPALVVDPRGELGEAFTVQLGRTERPVRQVATARLFPGRRLPVPMVVVDQGRLGAVDPHAGSRFELWTRGDPTAAQAAVLAQDAALFDTIDIDRVFRAADFVGITWTFGYLTALAGLVGLVAVGGLLLYLETRQRGRTASYAIGRRMGLSRGTHLRSLLVELGLLLGCAYAVGAGLAAGALGLVHGLLEVDPARPPTPILVLPVPALAGCAAAAAAVTVLAALYAQRAADRTDAAAVLRLA
jgi:putative ABC transport system permease protein